MMVVYDEHRSGTITVAAACIPIAIIAIILRFLARYTKRQNYYAEEWLAVGSLSAFLAYAGISIYGKLCDYLSVASVTLADTCMCLASDHGSGYDPYKLPYPVLVAYLKV